MIYLISLDTLGARLVSGVDIEPCFIVAQCQRDREIFEDGEVGADTCAMPVGCVRTVATGKRGVCGCNTDTRDCIEGCVDADRVRRGNSRIENCDQCRVKSQSRIRQSNRDGINNIAPFGDGT